MAQAVIEYYETDVLQDLNPYRKDDVLKQLVLVVKDDSEIGDKKRDELLDFYNEGQEGRFLGEVFLYVVNRSNKPGDDFVGFEDAPLIAEVNYECPICHEKLVDTIKNKPIKRYVITHIFPEGLSKDKSKELSAFYPKPKDLEQTDNLIALYGHCAEVYLTDPTVEEYQNIYDFKRILARNYKAKESVNAVDLEEDIRIVLDVLANVDESVQLVPLEYEALHIDEKFEAKHFMLKNETQIRVLQYYRYIESIFSDSETDFELIASEVKMSLQKLEKSGMPQSDVIDYLADWIRNKTNLGTIASRHVMLLWRSLFRIARCFIKMKFLSKVTPYKESIIAKFPVVLAKLEKKDMTPEELYKSMKSKVTDIREFMDIMDCLYALNKVELKGEVLHYVG